MPVEQQVLGLQVAVDDLQTMQVVERERHFGGVEFGYWVWEALWRRCQLTVRSSGKDALYGDKDELMAGHPGVLAGLAYHA